MQVGSSFAELRRSISGPGTLGASATSGPAQREPDRRTAPSSARMASLAFLILGMLALAGCSSSTPMSVFASRSDFAWTAQDLFTLIIWIAIVVFIVVEGGMVYAMWRFRERPGQGIPPQLHGNTRLEIAWTIAPAVVLAVIAVPTVTAIFETASLPPTGDALQIKVIGHQWWWEFQYPDQKLVTANEFHIPSGRPIVLSLESADVIHSFWIPRLGGKRDVVPNHVNYINFVAEPPSDGSSVTYLGQCVEFCGTSHANMRSRAIVHTPEGFDAWVKAQQAPVTTAPPEAFTKFAPVRKGREFPGSGPASSCIVCHTIEGTSARGAIGPNLSHLMNRQTMAAGIMETNEKNLAQWIRDPGSVKPGVKMPILDLSEAEVAAIAKYLAGLK